MSDAEARLEEAWDRFDREAEAILALLEGGADVVEVDERMVAARRTIETAIRENVTGDQGITMDNDCDHMEAVKWNPFNEVVQCHRCGQVFVPPHNDH